MSAQRATRARVPAQNPAEAGVKSRTRKRGSGSTRPVLVFPSQAKASQSVPPVVFPELDSGLNPVSNEQSNVEEAASRELNVAQEHAAPVRQSGSELTRRGWHMASSLSALAWENGKEQSIRTAHVSAELVRRGWYIARSLSALSWNNSIDLVLRACQICAELARRGCHIFIALTAFAWENGKEFVVRVCQVGCELSRRALYIAQALFALAWKNGKAQLSSARENGLKLLSSTWRNAGLLSSSAWRNFRAQQIARSTGKRLQVAATISLGEKRFVAVIKVDGREFLVGGGSSSVALLAQLDGTESKESFDQLLTKKLAVPGMPVAKKQPAKRTRKRIVKPTAEHSVEQA